MSRFARHRWLLARRAAQCAVLALFVLGPLGGPAMVEGSMVSNRIAGTAVLTDPFVLAQSILAGHRPGTEALIGTALVLAFYGVAGGRGFCAWFCPINPVTDLAAALRRRLGIDGGIVLSRRLRFMLLAAVMGGAAASGTILWESLNPVSMLMRGMVFGGWICWTAMIAVFCLDLVVARRGWCGHLCPQGAFWALAGAFRLIRIDAWKRNECDNCGQCHAACPEPRILVPPLTSGASTLVASSLCTNCGRCLDVCPKGVFRLGGVPGQLR